MSQYQHWAHAAPTDEHYLNILSPYFLRRHTSQNQKELQAVLNDELPL